MLNITTRLLIFRFFNLKLLDSNEKKFHRYKRVKLRRFSSNKILVSKANVNHFNNKIIITIFLFNKQKNLLKSRLEKLDLFFFFKIAKIIKKRGVWEWKKRTLIKRIQYLKKKRFITIVKHLYFFKNWNLMSSYIQQYKVILKKLRREIKKHIFYLQNEYSNLTLKIWNSKRKENNTTETNKAKHFKIINFKASATAGTKNYLPVFLELQRILYAYTPNIRYIIKTSLKTMQNIYLKKKALSNLFMSIYTVNNLESGSNKVMPEKTISLIRNNKFKVKHTMPYVVLTTLLEKRKIILQNVITSSNVIFEVISHQFNAVSNVTQQTKSSASAIVSGSGINKTNMFTYYNYQFSIRKLRNSILSSMLDNFNKILVKKVVKKEIQHYQFNQNLYLNKYRFVFSSINKLRNALSVLYSKAVYIKVINQKSFRLNSDLLSSAISIKLRDRKQKVVKILKKVVLSAKLPSRFLLLSTSTIKKPKILENLGNDTYYNFESKNLPLVRQNYILNTVPHKSMSGIRLEGAGRLTRRLTASRSIFKLKYAGSLKNINSSFALKKSPLLRGYSKSNLQYTVINSKTRNGAHGIKSWISSH